MDRSPMRDLIVGIFVLAGFAALFYLSVEIGGFDWHVRGHLKLTASFDETGLMSVRSPVVIAGVKVGEVTNITLGDDFRAKVDMELDSNLKLPTDTSAAIVTAGMMGDRYIALQPGGEEKLLKSGDRITFTESAVILEKLIGQLVYGVTKGEAKDKAATEPGAASGPATKPAATKP
jgi:phospholipid/cholesterol/gamma-HCH transport system substrate-binding protein